MAVSDSKKGYIYLSGCRSDTNQLLLPLPSAAVLFVLHYCDVDSFEVVFVDEKQHGLDLCVTMEFSVLLAVKHRFASVQDCALDCALPAMREDGGRMVRSGLCSTVRRIVAVAHDRDPTQQYMDLLGFRGGSLKACAEVSGWTKLCEVELPDTVSHMLKGIRHQTQRENSHLQMKLPENLMKLEWHFNKPVRIHNDDKKKRTLLAQIKQEAAKLTNSAEFAYERDIPCKHCIMRYRIQRKSVKSNSNQNGVMPVETEADLITDCSLSKLREFVEALTIDDIQYLHLYTEGIDITVADLILFTYMYFLRKEISAQNSNISKCLPRISAWFDLMTSLPRIQQAAGRCQIDLRPRVRSDVGGDNSSCTTEFIIPDDIKSPEDDQMELSRRCQGKYRAIKPDITKALDKVKEGQVEVTVSDHPRGDNVRLDWSSFPSRVDPGDNLPKKRLLRKREQLENLATAVLEVAVPGDVIVDFCSGGGHLGIVIAHLLPTCTIYLIENNEESLKIAKERVEELNLSNVILYQCNQDYFGGRFDVGVCLHACGVATDMVLKQCIHNKASFVICPCCYGGIQNTHYITYPRSRQYIKAGIGYKEYVTLGHVADQTEFNINQEEQGKLCMNLVDTDRAMFAREHGYKVTLCSLQPPTCTPKNNLLIGKLCTAVNNNQSG